LNNEKIPLDNIDDKVAKSTREDYRLGIEELAINIKAVGLLQPITVFQKSDDGMYELVAGQRRLCAVRILNEKYPNEGFDKIQTIVIPEPETDEEK
tara:strand:+ start:680 stop:967 length:288 start_codon:yes stop_codon:yes gene_type:complete